VVVIGSPFNFTSSGQLFGQEAPPVAVRCPSSGLDQEAFDGGVTIRLTRFGGSPDPSDVITLESSYPGLWQGSANAEILPLPVGATSGISTQPANAYEGKAVISQLATGDTAVITPYVICGP
jgi:hypothetical protein